MGLCGTLDASVPFDCRMEKAGPLALLSVIHERGITGRALSPSTNRAPRRFRSGRGALGGPRPRAEIPRRRGGARRRGNFVASGRRSRCSPSFLRRDRTADRRWTFPVDSRRDCVTFFPPPISAVFPIESIPRASFIHEQRKQRDDLIQLDFDLLSNGDKYIGKNRSIFIYFNFWGSISIF